MSLAIEGTNAWRASDPIRAADPRGGAPLSPWQALMASAALAPLGDTGGWQARIETGPARPSPPVVDDPERIETAEARPDRGAANDIARGDSPARPTKPAAPKPESSGVFEDGDFSLADLLDVINPLQHIPIVSSLYRELTGDRIGHGARLAGGVLFMGPLGGLSALANIVMLEASGKDVGDHAIALFRDDPAAPVLAANTGSPADKQKTEPKSPPTPDETALAELLPPGAIPLPGRSVDFTQAALRPPAIAPAPAPMPAAAENDDLPPPPPPPGPIAGPGWKGFYSPPEPPVEAKRADARRALAPDPMVALAAKRTPGAMAGSFAAPPPGALAAEGGWFSDAMLEALAKYQDAARLRGPQAPEAARAGGVNVVN